MRALTSRRRSREPARCCVNFRAPVASTALHVAMQKMVRDRVQHRLGRLRTGGIIEKNEIGLQRGKRGANLVYGEISHVAL